MSPRIPIVALEHQKGLDNIPFLELSGKKISNYIPILVALVGNFWSYLETI